MSPRTRITTLNLGSQSIELAEFRPHSDGALLLFAYRTRELFPGVAGGASRRGEVATAIRQLLAELQIKGGLVNYTVAEDLTFIRFVSLPAIEQEKIDRIIAFEAQQNVPFPIDQVIWDYKIVGGRAGEQNQVMLVAIKADLLEEINGAVEDAGLRTAVVDLATTALYNAYLHNYDEINSCSLLVDIGARTTNLLFVEADKIFTRSVSIGGSLITSAIAKEFNESFAAAESRKKRDGSADPLAETGKRRAETGKIERNNAHVGEEIARVSEITRTTLTRLHAEIARSITHYCTQQNGEAPQRILLSGGGASTSGIREYFQDKLQLPVEFFDPLRKITVTAEAEEWIGTSRHLLGEPVGLALRAVGNCPVALNLLPTSVVRREAMERRRPALVIAAICIVLSLLSWAAYYACATRLIRNETDDMQRKVLSLKPIEAQLNDLRKNVAGLDRVAVPLISAINDRTFWPETIEELNLRLPERDIWITELVATSKGVPIDGAEARLNRPEASPTAPPPPRQDRGPAEPIIDGLLVRGLYLFNPNQQEVVVEYFRNLVCSPWFAIDDRNQANVLKPTTPNDTEWAFPYELRLNLRTPIKFP